MNHALRLFLLGSMGFLVTARLLAIFFFQPFLAERDPLESKVDFALRYPETNLLAIGPSWIEMGFNPEVFDTEMSRKGIDSHSFNMGIGGLSLIEMRAVVERLLEKKPCCIKYLIISPCYECLNVARAINNPQSTAFFDWRHGLAFLNYVLLYSDMPDDLVKKPDFVRNIVSSVFLHYSNLGLAARGSSRFEDLSTAYWYERRPRGYAHVDKTLDQEEARQYEKQVEDYRGYRTERIQVLQQKPSPEVIHDLVSDEMFEVFVEQLRAFRDKGISVLVIIPPNMWEWQYHVAFLARLRAHCRDDIPFVDFGDSEKWPELFLPPEIRYDDAHFDAKGAVVWSGVLADQFAKALQTQTWQHSDRQICAWK
jgi:hypothetical protein